MAWHDTEKTHKPLLNILHNDFLSLIMFSPSFFRDVNGGRGGSNVNASVDTLRVAEARVKAVIAERFEEAVAGILNDRLPIPVFLVFKFSIFCHDQPFYFDNTSEVGRGTILRGNESLT